MNGRAVAAWKNASYITRPVVKQGNACMSHFSQGVDLTIMESVQTESNGLSPSTIKPSGLSVWCLLKDS